MKKTGKRAVIDGNEAFEVIINGLKAWLPVHPEIVYKGEWKGWNDFLGVKHTDAHATH